MDNQDLYNRKGYITFLAVVALNIAFFIYLTMVHPGVAENPGENYGIESTK